MGVILALMLPTTVMDWILRTGAREDSQVPALKVIIRALGSISINSALRGNPFLWMNDTGDVKGNMG